MKGDVNSNTRLDFSLLKICAYCCGHICSMLCASLNLMRPYTYSLGLLLLLLLVFLCARWIDG
jgi:hypothetical protein